MSKAFDIILIIGLIIAIAGIIYYYEQNVDYANAYSKLYNETVGYVDNLNAVNQEFYQFKHNLTETSKENSTDIAIAYYVNDTLRIAQVTVSYDAYNLTHTAPHYSWSHDDLTKIETYITTNDTTIKQLVEIVSNQTTNEEDSANALLSLVQDKGPLSIRYYPTNELKYPLETLVEMGGDCDTHSILYATLMKTAGFKVLILYSNETIGGQYHVAVAINLEHLPTYLNESEVTKFNYDNQDYYYAETTGNGWRIGDIPLEYKNGNFTLIPI